jgi:hypothetical protein
VSLEVGTEGKLGGVAVVEGVEGVWHELTVNVCWPPLVTVRALLKESLTGQSNVSKSDATGAVYRSRHDSRRPGMLNMALRSLELCLLLEIAGRLDSIGGY